MEREPDQAPERVITENTPDEQELADDITMRYGGFWVLIAARGKDDGLALSFQVGPGVGRDLGVVQQLIKRAQEAL